MTSVYIVHHSALLKPYRILSVPPTQFEAFGSVYFFRLTMLPLFYHRNDETFSTLINGSPRSVSISITPVRRKGMEELIIGFAWR